MHALITGGAGFLGTKLAAALLRSPAELDVTRVTLFDTSAAVPADPRLTAVAGDIADPAAVAAVAADADLVWHLAAVVSFGAERDVDLGYRVNVDGTRLLLEALRGTGRRPRVVFASSFAVYGGDLPPVVGRARRAARRAQGPRRQWRLECPAGAACRHSAFRPDDRVDPRRYDGHRAWP